MSSFSVNLTAIQYKIPEDEELDKSDVIINIKPDIRLNFQIKEIHFHPQDKTQHQFNDEIGWVKARKNGKNPRMHIYNYPSSSWQTAVQTILDKMENTNAYTISEKGNMDLLFFLDDGSLPSDKNYSFDKLDNYGYRSISMLDYCRGISIVLFTQPVAPKLFIDNQSLKKKCTWTAYR